MEEFNKFYAKFEEQDCSIRNADFQDGSLLASFNEECLVKLVKRCKTKERSGPDGISGRVFSVQNNWVLFLLTFLIGHLMYGMCQNFGNSLLLTL